MAEQARDDGAAQAIVFAEPITAHGGDAAALDRFGIARQFPVILGIRGANRADCAHTHAIEVRAGFGRVPLEIPVQGTLPLSNRQLIVAFGEMIHADIEVTGAEEFLYGRT